MNDPSVNPYESPATASQSVEAGRQFPFDVGKLVGNYLLVLVAMQVATILFEWITTKNLNLNFGGLLLFFAGVGLRRNNRVARSCVLFFGTLIAIVSLIVFGIACSTGNGQLQHLRVDIEIVILYEIENPTMLHLLAVTLIMSIMAIFPVAMLLTRQAKREFSPDVLIRRGIETAEGDDEE